MDFIDYMRNSICIPIPFALTMLALFFHQSDLLLRAHRSNQPIDIWMETVKTPGIWFKRVWGLFSKDT